MAGARELASGALFGVGLVVSGMTKPSKVTGFLDLAGAWDASLMFVMVGAIAVHFVAYRFILRIGGQPWWKSAASPASGSDTLGWAVALDTRT